MQAIQPFRIERPQTAGLTGLIGRTAVGIAEHMLAFPALNDIYTATTRRFSGGFCERALDVLGVTAQVSARDYSRVPATGPLLVVANHPFGGLEGMVLAALLQRVRPDVKLLTNYLLGKIPDMHEVSFFVDPFGGPDAARRNVASMKGAIQWLQDGHCLGVFPAGEVSHLTFQRLSVTDPNWSTTVGRVARRAKAAVLPIYFDGRNSTLFQLAGLIHPRLRTLLLPREMLRKRDHAVRVLIGEPIPAQRLDRFDDDMALTDYLRFRTYILRGRAEPPPAASRHSVRLSQPVISPEDPAALAAEVDALSPRHRLVDGEAFRVYCAPASLIPRCLREIGRLRELTFRAVGEGTGRALDIDRYDAHYQHLFVWQPSQRRIIGAYRLGPSDRIIRRFGIAGLYTATLFRMRPALLERLGAALELGRSFVIQEFQKSYSPLMLLWRGIGRYVATRPRYRYLFGPVSISEEYQSLSKRLLIAFLKANDYRNDLAEFVRPRNPPRLRPQRDFDEHLLSCSARDVNEVDELVGEIESDGKRMPVLLRQYLGLRARLLGFNVDPDFGDVLDGLILIDLTRVDRPILDRYLGRAGAARFLAKYSETPDQSASASGRGPR